MTAIVFPMFTPLSLNLMGPYAVSMVVWAIASRTFGGSNVPAFCRARWKTSRAAVDGGGPLHRPDNSIGDSPERRDKAGMGGPQQHGKQLRPNAQSVRLLCQKN